MKKLNIKKFFGEPFAWNTYEVKNVKRDGSGNLTQVEVYANLWTMGYSIDTIYEIDANGNTSWETSSWTIEEEVGNKTTIHKTYSSDTSNIKGIELHNWSNNYEATLYFHFTVVDSDNKTTYITKDTGTAVLKGNVVNNLATYDYNNAPSVAAVRNYLESGGVVRGDGTIRKIIECTYSQYQDLANNYNIDSNTEYHIPETASSQASLESFIQSIILASHPIGSIEMNITGDNPSTYIGGTWVQVSQGRAIFGEGTCSTTYNVRGTSQTFSNTYTADTNYAAGLPNITGTGHYADNNNAFAGALYNAGSANYIGDGSASGTLIALDASRDRAIYGKSNTVQPNAYVVYVWKRTA
ncbi:MAG: hypothetical protein IIT65_09470 [Lachnospiraceae bacterium]|nr:hypothetical protein [Lachnospiraceae bacterium]